MTMDKKTLQTLRKEAVWKTVVQWLDRLLVECK